MLTSQPVITLTTDFGGRDGFVGAMKGVILSINPDARIVDLSHGIPRQDVFAGAMVMRNACPYYPPGTVHVVVVDPGVGSDRRAIVAETTDAYYVLPDNGLITLVDQLTPVRAAYSIENMGFCLPEISRTFHGRDIFAPVAAHLSRGLSPEQVGPPLESFAELDLPTPSVSHNLVRGSIVYADVYGNLFTNIGPAQISPHSKSWRLELNGKSVTGFCEYYSSVKEKLPLMIFGSSGFLEIAVNGGNALEYFGANVGDTFSLQHIDKS
ncbi:SAM-dependent chlorinase/fluorinase [Sulfidibacter corallicola]|uniref:SAM-dependent chlorinase/fluorinase n=1 Tax=Sulfidibacter corallicola TaxID=2818388 RepID=A0A8A4TUX7_SULCO|nr:SAM-dependent chlorinase/fluorinase [Sulfidibacter corallicola]QTD52921.1 SAM-dependent chlorinase/fluorinase [Sulfidibacter corallicola]